jgi:hypothetical protein
LGDGKRPDESRVERRCPAARREPGLDPVAPVHDPHRLRSRAGTRAVGA